MSPVAATQPSSQKRLGLAIDSLVTELEGTEVGSV